MKENLSKKPCLVLLSYSAIATVIFSTGTWDKYECIMSLISCTGISLIVASLIVNNDILQKIGIYCNLSYSLFSLLLYFVNRDYTDRLHDLLIGISNGYYDYEIEKYIDSCRISISAIYFFSLLIITWILMLVYYYTKIKIVGIISGSVCIGSNFVVATSISIIFRFAYVALGIALILFVNYNSKIDNKMQ